MMGMCCFLGYVFVEKPKYITRIAAQYLLSHCGISSNNTGGCCYFKFYRNLAPF